MHYLIDGYNLLFRRLESRQSIQNQRQNLINALQKIAHTLNLSATVVFDSTYQEYEGSRSHIQTLEVVFTDQGQTADDYIVDEVRRHSNPRQLIVVTSDNKLAWRSRQLGAKTESVEEFGQWTKERLKNRERKEAEIRETTWSGLETETEEERVSAQEEEHTVVPKASAEESFDYYLKMFEEEDSKAEKRAPRKKVSREKMPEEEAPEEQKSVDRNQSDMERWLDIFEKKSSKDDS